MALIVPGELVNTSSDPSRNKIVEDGIGDAKDTFTNRTAISPDRYHDVYGTLLGFGDGSPIIVEYYSKQNALVNKQTTEIDHSSTRHSVHTDYLLIHDFEIRLEGPFESSYNEETTETVISGVGVTYPGFSPSIGDVFLYDLPDGQIGKFVITGLARLSIQHGTYHRINFSLQQFVNTYDLTKLNTSVNEEVYFDKQKYLSNNASLLKGSDYLDLRALRRYREIFVQYLFQRFWSIELQTIIRPDGVYDPYVVDYIQKKTSIIETGQRPQQLYTEMTDAFSSIWHLFTGSKTIDLSSVVHRCFTIKNEDQIWDATITALINKPFIHLDDRALINAKKDLIIVDDEEEEEITYVFSKAFYTENINSMTAFERMVYDVIQNDKLTNSNVHTFIDYIKDFRAREELVQFYEICVYIYMIDKIIKSIV